MSRIGRKPIPVPAGVKIQLAPAAVEVQGPKGKLTVRVPRGIRFEQKDGMLTALRETDEQRALHGLARALVANAVRGVTGGLQEGSRHRRRRLSRRSQGQDRRFRARLFASRRVPYSRRHSDHGGKADAVSL